MTTLPLPEALTHARTLQGQGKLDQAIDIYEKILPHLVDKTDLQSIMAGAYSDLATAYRSSAPQKAIPLLERAVALNPSSQKLLFDLGTLYLDIENGEKALQHFKTAARKTNAKTAPNIQTALGSAYRLTYDFKSSEKHLKKALDIDPKYKSALLNLAALYKDWGHYGAAIDLLTRFLTLYPGEARATYNLALAQFGNGQLQDGWRNYGSRERLLGQQFIKRQWPFKQWSGEPLDGKTVLLWSDQGIGDELLYGSMIADILAMNPARVILEGYDRLIPLWKRSYPQLECHPVAAEPSETLLKCNADVQCALPDLGQYLRKTPNAFPASVGFLEIDRQHSQKLRADYLNGRQDCKLVGISWGSFRPGVIGDNKSIPLDKWAGILQLPGCQFVNLQYGGVENDMAAAKHYFGVDIINNPDINPLQDMDGAASEIGAMDLVITVSNTTAHLAGAIGAPTWALLPKGPGRLWYWFDRQDKSLWYPAMDLFNQTRAGYWDGILQQVERKLAAAL